MKTLNRALVRERIPLLEEADKLDDPQVQNITYAVISTGPTGVNRGAIAEIAKRNMMRDFPKF
ncbi:hypothetical protein [Rhodohalobacter sp.]|uniref:hypothetical protein n=1 Tax=Rhodohalobacter sp. TaxID=1974210 RepID=UPI002ACE9109|nr:hypothetical protein [Rhodohalobacter sp.]MDZ7758291.1 hypothetical protein [Rhodohalobacter sp.]